METRSTAGRPSTEPSSLAQTIRSTCVKSCLRLREWRVSDTRRTQQHAWWVGLVWVVYLKECSELTCVVSDRRFPGGLGCGGAEDGHAARQAEGAAGQGGCSTNTPSAPNRIRATGMSTLYLVVYALCHLTHSQ